MLICSKHQHFFFNFGDKLQQDTIRWVHRTIKWDSIKIRWKSTFLVHFLRRANCSSNQMNVGLLRIPYFLYGSYKSVQLIFMLSHMPQPINTFHIYNTQLNIFLPSTSTSATSLFLSGFTTTVNWVFLKSALNEH